MLKNLPNISPGISQEFYLFIPKSIPIIPLIILLISWVSKNNVQNAYVATTLIGN